MKTAEAWVAEIFLAKRSSHEYQKIVRQIQSEVREEAAKIAETLPCRFHPTAFTLTYLQECHDACAAAIRKMELP